MADRGTGPGADLVAAGQALQQWAERHRSVTRLRLRARADGRVRARLAEGSRYNSPPALVGEIVAAPGGGMLTATIRESFIEVFGPRMFVGLAVFMAVVFAGLVAAGDPRNPGLYICSVAAILFGLLGRTLGRMRRGSFRDNADRLEHAVRDGVRAVGRPPRRAGAG